MANKLAFKTGKNICGSWLLGGVFLCVFPISTLAAKLYKWVDEEGRVHYSDRLPPHLAKKEHEELNERGIIVKNIEREQSSQEREQERLEELKLQEERRKEMAATAKQNLRDKILLDTFTTERDLLLTRDERLSMVDSIINLTVSNNQIVQKQIDETQSQVEALQKGNREVPDNLRKKLMNLEGQLEKNKEFIDIKTKERRQLESQFKQDLMRYRELKESPEENGTKAAEESSQTDNTISTSDTRVNNITSAQPQ